MRCSSRCKVGVQVMEMKTPKGQLGLLKGVQWARGESVLVTGDDSLSTSTPEQSIAAGSRLALQWILCLGMHYSDSRECSPDLLERV